MVEVSETNASDAPRVESFVKDIQDMMYGLGDCSKPLRESASLIETIVIDQMALILSQARDAMNLRGGNILSPEDILFLIKRNKAALKRFITYMGVKDEKQSIEASMKVPSSQDEPNSKTWGISEDEILTLTDVIKEERTARACRISLFLTPKQYEEFHAARCKSFNTNMSSKRFHDWIKSRIMFDDELSPAVLEILIYLAKETIASLVDMILSIREENGSAPTYSTAITIPEIQEAIRRHSCQQTLTFASFSKDLSSTVHKMEDNSSSYSNIDSLLRPDSILTMRSNHAGPEVDDGDSLYGPSESFQRPSILAIKSHYDGSSMTTLQSTTTEVTFMDVKNQLEPMKKSNDSGKNFRYQGSVESDSILELPLNISNEIEIISSRIKVMQQMWDEQQEHLGRLQGELYDLRHSFKVQSSYCSGLGATLGNIIWKASRDEKIINNFIELGEISELFGIASGTLVSFINTYISTVPDVDTNETQFVLSIMGIVSNIAALKEGRKIIRNDPEGKTLIELIVRLLPSVPSGSGDPLRKLLLRALYNICLDEDGLCGLYENKEFLICIVNIINTSTPEVIILALRVLENLTSGIKDLKSYLILRNNIPLDTIEKLSHSSDSETRHHAMKVLKNLNDALNKFNPSKNKRKNKRPKYICRP